MMCGGEFDFVMCEFDGMFVFVEVCVWCSIWYGGVVVSVGWCKWWCLVVVVLQFWLWYGVGVVCCFDVVVFEVGWFVWLCDVFCIDDVQW